MAAKRLVFIPFTEDFLQPRLVGPRDVYRDRQRDVPVFDCAKQPFLSVLQQVDDSSDVAAGHINLFCDL